MPDQALQIAAEMQADPELQPLGPTNEVEVALLEAKAWFAKTNRAKAEGIINSLLTSHPGNADLLDRAGAILIAYGSYSNALQIAEGQLQSGPDNPFALVNKAASPAIGDFSNAIPPLTRSLALTNTYGARLDRAYAYVQTCRLDAPRPTTRNSSAPIPPLTVPTMGWVKSPGRKRTPTRRSGITSIISPTPCPAPRSPGLPSRA